MERPNTTLSGDEHGYGRVRQSYHRAARWSRVAMVAFWVIFAAFVFWAVPFFPWGMSSDDYSAEVLLGLFLLGCCPGVTAIALLARSIAAQRREALVAWASIYDKTTGLRNREFFLDRLQLQCELARDLEEYRVGLILLSIDELPRDGQKPQPANDDVLRRVGAHIARQLRPNDLLAATSSTEMAILVSDGSEAALCAVASRIEHSLQVRIKGLAGDAAARLTIEMGLAMLDSGDLGPEALLESARSRLSPVYSAMQDMPAA
ncbi:MAG: diguanylate cyclase [Dehalococcoidia bacterium]|nr:diguanylate cyclase [Dehalococcoidia bacterium]